ncbi:hypothetical protein [Halocynthiibacter sp.]|uniref:hypothetical protein n=1 Tax=Halocynthiibacter sp. TaxID=1979210 RepID=UPI003C58155B
MQNKFQDLKQRFHVVQLAQFNAKVLEGLQRNAKNSPSGPFQVLIDLCASQTISAFPPAPSTLNQSVHFSMAYLTLVWLWESLTEDQVKAIVSNSRVSKLLSDFQLEGPRAPGTCEVKLKLMRNALSHGKVKINDGFVFEFWDQRVSGKTPEVDSTHLLLKSEALGEFLTEFYFATSDIVYPNK